jgi:hypothetical protein
MNHLIDEKLMVRYWLGELPEEERTQLEETFFADDESFERALAVKYDLIDRYNRGELSPRERQRFEESFLSSPLRREKVEVARVFLQAISEKPVEPPEEVRVRDEKISWWQTFLASLRPPRPAFQLALVAVAAMVIVGGAWLVVERAGMRSQLAKLQAERQELQQREQELQQQAAQKQKLSDELIEQLQHQRSEVARLEQELAKQQTSRPTMVSFFLLPGAARDIGEPKKLVIPPGAVSVQLRLNFQSDSEYKSYSASLIRTTEGNEIWKGHGLQARPANRGKVVIVRLPASILTPSEYELTLWGLSDEGQPELITYYYFKVDSKK